ncbi:MAG: YcxB family protein [Chloroflexota bacterium]|nr:MAG: hypothetical protein DIU80_14840 [Chloroflexota bacterium]
MTPTATANASAQTLVLRYTQQIGELTHAARLYQRTTRKHQLYKVLGALVIFLAAWLVLTRGPAVGPALLVVLGAFLWFDPVPLLVIYGAFRNSPAVREPYETVIDERGTHITIGGNRVNRTWDKYLGFLESDRVFVLVYGRWGYTVIPKRALADQAQVAALREMLRARIRGAS